MSIRQIIMVLGFFIIFLPFLGFSSTVDLILNILVGLLIIILAYKLYPADLIKNKKEDFINSNLDNKNDLPFLEHKKDQDLGSGSLS